MLLISLSLFLLVTASRLQWEMTTLLSKLTRATFLYPHEYDHYLRVRNQLATMPIDSYPGFVADFQHLDELLASIPLESFGEKS